MMFQGFSCFKLFKLLCISGEDLLHILRVLMALIWLSVYMFTRFIGY